MRKGILLITAVFVSSCASVSPPNTYPTHKNLPSPPVLSKRIYHRVKKGDTLWKISRMYSVDIDELIARNSIRSANNLVVGRKIHIPTRRPTQPSQDFVWPARGEIISFFGDTADNSVNNGLDIRLNPENNIISAAAEGKVIFSRYLKGWGKTIIIKHDRGFYTVYANIDNILVDEGAHTEKGHAIGKISSAENKCILHFEIRKKHIPQNPLKYFANHK